MKHTFLFLLTLSSSIFAHELADKFDLTQLKSTDKMVGMLIIGGGPAGLTAAMNGGNLGIPTMILTGYDMGGQINLTTTIDNWPGVRKSPTSEIIETLYNQAKDFGAEISHQRAESIEIENGPPFKVTTDNGEIIYAWSLVIATGSEVKRCGVMGEDKYFGQGVSPCAKCDGHFFKGQDVVIIGGGNTALTEATELSAHAKNVTVLVRSNQMKAAHKMQKEIERYDKVKIQFNKGLMEILGDDKGVTGVKVKDNLTQTVDTLETNGVFLAIGRRPRNELVINKLNLDKAGYILTDEKYQSVSHPGIFAAGEIGDPNCAQAVEAASSGSVVASGVHEFLREIGINDNFWKNLKAKLPGI